MNKEAKSEDLMKLYLNWYILVIVTLAVISGIALAGDGTTGIVVTGVSLLASATLLFFSFNAKRNITKALIRYSMANDSALNIFTQDLDIPYALMDERGNLAWRNRAFHALIAGDKQAKKSITAMFAQLDGDTIEEIKDKLEVSATYRDRTYRVRIMKTQIEASTVCAVYLYDETEFIQTKKDLENNRSVIGLIYMDNYDEAMESVEDVRRSLLIALIDRKINQYIGGMDGIVKKLEKDKFLFFIKKEHIEKLIKERVEILEDVKTVNIGNAMSVTLSIGIGLGADTYVRNYEYARTAIDMALGRGGDQAVLKDASSIKYFGGKSQSVEKTTRVKARVKAHALRELLETKDKVLIMGHKIIDTDAFGAAIGIWRIMTSFNKKAYIVLGDINTSAKPIVDMFRTSEYPNDIFITEDSAKTMVDDGTLLVVVDVNRPSITEAPILLKKAKTIVVLDHHRQSSEIIENATLSYVEPFASSACEMVAEVVQYIDDGIKLKTIEADAMYAGIVIDTNNFSNQTGVRTFEAAAFLRRSGADITRVRKIFREDINDYRAKAEAIHNAEIFKEYYAISECSPEYTASPTLVCAQAANELLNIKGIRASFVLTSYNGTIYISARSIDEVNVQIVMEKLGGGGHRSVAGAQLKEIDIRSAKEKIRGLLSEMIEKGEIA